MQHILSLSIAIYRCLVVFLFVTFCGFGAAVAQERCGTVEYGKNVRGQASEGAFEQWLQQKISQRKLTAGRTQAAYTIPVVVHVIHNGEAVGVGTNISDAQVLSQISVLNKDYQRLNADANKTPAEFLPVAASADIQFVLAKQDPEGLPTNGIERVRGEQTSWLQRDNYLIKKQSYWPSEDYLNIWVCNITDYLGYAQFPIESTLEGIDEQSKNAETDGVVIAYNAFGSNDDGNFTLLSKYAKGRTATHEIGHFLGLRHIWGDVNSCNNNDYVDDTPVQNGQTNGCPSHPHATCGNTASMFQNYLDYTDDACMNLFTEGQVARMNTVLANSPRRKSLMTSPGLQEPQPKANDLGIRRVISPADGVCPTGFTPIVEVRNYGSNDVTTARIRMRIDGVERETRTFTFSTLPSAPTNPPAANVTFSPVTLGSGTYTFSFEILQTNTTTDGVSRNNTISQTTVVPNTIATPIEQKFDSYPGNWTVLNPDNQATWEHTIAPNGDVNNGAMVMEFYTYENRFGELDMLITPVFDLSDVPFALFKFDVAYAQFESTRADGLRVVVLTDCNTDISQGTVIFDQSGAALATAPAINSAAFVPQSKDEWKTITYNLASFVGSDNVQIALVGINDYGNNLYVDNLRVLTEAYENLTLDKLVTPSPVINSNTAFPQLRVTNAGTTVNSFDVSYTINGNTATVSYSGEDIAFGETTLVDLPSVSLADGMNEITFTVANPNGKMDEDPADNDLTSVLTVTKATAKIPFREDFEQAIGDRWVIINPRKGKNWEVTTPDGDKALTAGGYSNTTVNDELWFASRVLDFSKTSEAMVFFDLAYAYRDGRNDQLRVLGSIDGGYTFDRVLYSAAGSLLSTTTSVSDWKPSGASDWVRKGVDLSSLAGEKEVRLAFVVTNGNGNNVFLDNIEVFLSNEIPVRISSTLAVYPNPTTEHEVNVTVNLPELSDATLEVVNMMGRTIFSQDAKDLLNQTYPLVLPNATPGVYIVRLRTEKGVYSTRVVLMTK